MRKKRLLGNSISILSTVYLFFVEGLVKWTAYDHQASCCAWILCTWPYIVSADSCKTWKWRNCENQHSRILQNRIVDEEGTGMHSCLRKGSRKGFPSISSELMNMICECEQECLLGLSESRISHFYESFRKFSCNFQSQEKENQYLFDFMQDRSTK